MAEENKKDDPKQPDTSSDAAKSDTTADAEKDAEKLSMTQEDLDAMIEKRLARERKKWEKGGTAKPAAQPATPPDAGAAVPNTGATVPAATDHSAELAEKDTEIRDLHAQFAAMKAGVKPDMVEDAVYLAIKSAEKGGEEADEDDIADALKDVLKRHPEWKAAASADDKKKGGFKVGADGAGNGNAADTKNALPTGRVIF